MEVRFRWRSDGKETPSSFVSTTPIVTICLDVESEHLTPIMVSMVHCHRQADYMLDNTSKAMEMLKNTKQRLYSTLMEPGDMTEERIKRVSLFREE